MIVCCAMVLHHQDSSVIFMLCKLSQLLMYRRIANHEKVLGPVAEPDSGCDTQLMMPG